ncbi:PIN domain-containing protein [Ralstonia solanacearum]|uniref:PIN domain-containing protein n=1 Tax=Ralstonia solanacearum TaxID=305 RepID=UPI0035199D8D
MEAALSSLPSPAEVAESEVRGFLIDTNAIVIEVDHTLVDRVLDLYFDRKPPFCTDGKRSEFPDAFALLGIEDMCRQTVGGTLIGSNQTHYLPQGDVMRSALPERCYPSIFCMNTLFGSST